MTSPYISLWNTSRLAICQDTLDIFGMRKRSGQFPTRLRWVWKRCMASISFIATSNHRLVIVHIDHSRLVGLPLNVDRTSSSRPKDQHGKSK